MPRTPIFITLLLLCFLFSQAQTARYTEYIEHKVRWMENIHTISKKYKVDPNVLLEYNHISANQIRRGIILRIPVGHIESRETDPSDTLNLNDPLILLPDYLSECINWRPSPFTEHRVSLILPFQLSGLQPNNQFLEFYEGLLIAVQELKEEGMSIRLSPYDSENFSRLPSLIQSGAFLNEDLIIGPVYANEVMEVLNYTHGQNIKIISPLDPQTESAAYTNPNFFQVSSSLYWQQANLIQYMLKNSGMVWLFYEEDGSDQELVSISREILRKNHIVYQEFTHKVSKGSDVTGELALRLSPHRNNQVIVASSDEPFVSDILRNLSLVQSRRNYPITLYGNARWRNFDSVDYEYYHSMNLHLSVTNYVDYQRPEVKSFLARYRALYRTEPSPFAFQGYDVGAFFLRALYTKGPHFEYCLERGLIPAQPLQSSFHFQKISPEGGYLNTDTRIIRFLPDYRIEVLH